MKNGKELDKKILNAIKEHGAMTRKEIQKELGYTNLYDRLRRMIRKEQIKFIPHENKTHIYYVEDEGLISWSSKLPEDERIDILIKAGLLDKNELRNAARQRGISMREIAKEKLILEESKKWNWLFGGA